MTTGGTRRMTVRGGTVLALIALAAGCGSGGGGAGAPGGAGGTGGDAAGPGTFIGPAEPGSPAAMENLLDGAQAFLAERLREGEGPEVVAELAALLGAEPGVSSARLAPDGRTLWITFASGRESFLITDPETQPATPVESQGLPLTAAPSLDIRRGALEVGTATVALFLPFQADFGTDVAGVAQAFEAAGFTVNGTGAARAAVGRSARPEAAGRSARRSPSPAARSTWAATTALPCSAMTTRSLATPSPSASFASTPAR